MSAPYTSAPDTAAPETDPTDTAGTPATVDPDLPDAGAADADAVVEPVDSDDDDDDGDGDDDDGDGDDENDADGDDDGDDTADDLLVREGDVAGDYLERLLDILDVDGDIDLDVEGDRASVAIVGGQLDDLTGADGAVLEALQELTRLAVAQSTGVRSRLMLDVGGYRAKRRADLTSLAAETAGRVSQSRQPERMAPMNPFERKVVHDVVAGVAGVHSESEGEEPNRRVVVLPDK